MTADVLILIARIVSVALGAAVIGFSCRRLPIFRVRVFFCLSIAGFCLSALFFAEESATLSWIKHFLFYGGQIFFLFFIASALKIYEEPDLPETSTAQKNLPLLASIGSFSRFLYEQGIQHIFTVFLAIAILVFMSARSMIIDFKDHKFPVKIFSLAILILASLHAVEFFTESQKIFIISDSLMNAWEFAATYIGVLLLLLGINQITWPRVPVKKDS